jgi:putative DNA primase/helicase
MGTTQNAVLASETKKYLENLDPSKSPEEIESDLLDNIQLAFEVHNATADKGYKWRIPNSLSHAQIAAIMAKKYPICRIACAGSNSDTDYDLLAIYKTDGPDEGIYVTSDDELRRIAREFNYNLTSKDFNEVIMALRDMVPRKNRCIDPDLIAVNNGIFNYDTKTLQPFSPDLVFLTKSRVNYNPNATNITIHNSTDNTDWDIESWISELSDDQEIVNVLWEILGAIIRPNVRWNKSAWFYSETGNNGKGTLCELMRELCGSGAYASIPLSDFGKDFVLEPLTRATAIIVDENDVGTFIDKAANVKAVITNDVIQINRKFKTPIAYQFYGFMVQCLNEFPRIKDKSDSFYRRQLFIPFDKCFTGHERKYIKNDYLHRTEVLEYVMKRVLEMNYYSLSEPTACRNILQEYKAFNDPIRQFWEEISNQLVWDLVPYGFIYSLYKSWFKINSPSGAVQGKNTFVNDLLNVVKDDPDWYGDKSTTVKVAHRMDKPELLISQYGLSDWQRAGYKGGDVRIMCTPDLMNTQVFRGLQRVACTQTAAITVSNDD